MAYSQNDPLWKDNLLGNGPGTIGQAGCFITAFANVSAFFNKDTTPDQMNELMKQNGWFADDGQGHHDLVANHQVPALLYPDAVAWDSEQHWASATDLAYFSDANDPNIAYIIEISSPSVPSHFTMVWATTGSDLIIDDSWDGIRKHLSTYGDASSIIQAAYKYRRASVTSITQATPPLETTNTQQGEDMATITTQGLLESLYREILTMPGQPDRALDAEAMAYIGQPFDQVYNEVVNSDEAQKVRDARAALLGQANSLTAKVSDLNSQDAQAEQTISNLTSEANSVTPEVTELKSVVDARDKEIASLQVQLAQANQPGKLALTLLSLPQYNKLWVALAGGGVAILTQHFGVGNEYVQLAITALTALGVYTVPNKTQS